MAAGVAVTALAVAPVVSAQSGFEEGFAYRDPPLARPETLSGAVRQGGLGRSPGRINRIADVFAALGACWSPPTGLTKLERVEITVRLSLRRDGSLFGAPRVTFATTAAETRARELLRAATVEAIERCTPLDLTPGLGGAIAGRPIAVRFIYQGPRGRGA